MIEDHISPPALDERSAEQKICGCGPDCRCGPDCACGPDGKCSPACTCDR